MKTYPTSIHFTSQTLNFSLTFQTGWIYFESLSDLSFQTRNPIPNSFLDLQLTYCRFTSLLNQPLPLFIPSSRNPSTNFTISPEYHTNKLSYPYFKYFSNFLISLTWLLLFLSCSNYRTYFTNQNLCTILFAITFDSYLYFSMTNPASSVNWT